MCQQGLFFKGVRPHQTNIAAQVLDDALNVGQPVSDVASVAVQEQNGR